MKYKVINIEYDTDGENIDLPKELEIELELDTSDLDDDDIHNHLSDEISNITGYCHFGFNIDDGTETDNGMLEILFATWLQDNYSQNTKQGGTKYLPKGFMREDFTDNSYPISQIYKIYIKKMM